jgi:hypothetical protein
MAETHVNVAAKLNGITACRDLFQKSFGSPDVTIDKRSVP